MIFTASVLFERESRLTSGEMEDHHRCVAQDSSNNQMLEASNGKQLFLQGCITKSVPPP